MMHTSSGDGRRGAVFRPAFAVAHIPRAWAERAGHRRSLSEVVAVGSSSIRDGKGHRAYRREQAALKRRTRAHDLPCGHGSPSGWGCGESIDTTLPDTHRMSFTADHDQAIANGGRLAGQVLVPMHRSCNSRKSNHAATEIWRAS